MFMKKHNSGISIYGTTKTYNMQERRFGKRFWHKRTSVKGKVFKQRYHHKINQRINVSQTQEQRFSLYGNLRDVKRAEKKIKTEGWIPLEKFQDRVDAKDFLKNPEKYAKKEGKWETQKTKDTP